MIYRVYYWDLLRRWNEVDLASLTEATILKLKLKREGITARIIGIRTTVGG